MEWLAINPFYAIAGVAVSILVGLTGVGGGSLMTPLLVLAFGFHPVTAVGTDLLYASATKSVGTAVHGASGTVHWKIVQRACNQAACRKRPADLQRPPVKQPATGNMLVLLGQAQPI